MTCNAIHRNAAKTLWRIMMILSLTMAILLSSPLPAFSENDPFAVSYTTYDTTYDAILKMYIKVLNTYGTGREGRHDLFNELIISDFDSDYESPVKSRIAETKNRVGFLLHDLNNDGIDELIIGENPSYVFEVFTIDNGKVRELIRAGYHYTCALLENGAFFRVAKDGAAKDSFTVWKMNGAGEVSFVEGYLRDAEPDDPALRQTTDDLLFFHMTDSRMHSGTSDTFVSREQFLDWLKNYDQAVLQLSFIPLGLYELGAATDYTKIGIVSVDGKTQGNSKVRIRAKASRKAKIIKNCKVGTYVSILGEEGDYYKISVDQKEGYIQKEFLTIPGNAENTGRYGLGYESYRNWINGSGVSPVLPAPTPTPEAENENTPVVSPLPESSEEYVIDHYETVEVQRSRTVLDHYETYYTYSDNGQGQFIEESHERPVYRTEYFTETIQQPVYRKVGE